MQNDELAQERRFASLESEVTAVKTAWRSHEAVCASRWGLLIKLIGWGGGGFAALLTGVCGWALAQIHSDQQQQMGTLSRLLGQTSQIQQMLPPRQ